MNRAATAMLLACLAPLSCSRLERIAEGRPTPTTSAPPLPSQFRAGGGGSGPVARVMVEDAPVTGENLDRIRSREADLMWTNPDNPESGMEGMEEVMAESAKRGVWWVSFSEARRAGMRSSKPVLVWFTDTARSPLCRFLSAEVFSKPEFAQWAESEVIRVRLDFNVKGVSRGPRQSAEDDAIRKRDYLESLKKRYKVRGFPSVLLLAPDGTVMGRYRGYRKTYHDFYYSRLKKDAESARAHHEAWKEKMARRGYREWADRKERTVFAKLLRYHEGTLILVEPDGKRLKAKLSNLSQADQDWITAEKKKRGISG